MSVIYKFLFPSKPDGTAMSLLILALRILFGILLMSHGVQKWANYDVMSGSFPDPLGIGSQLSLVLAIFGEMVCSMAFIFGFLYRLAMLPKTSPFLNIIRVGIVSTPYSSAISAASSISNLAKISLSSC